VAMAMLGGAQIRRNCTMEMQCHAGMCCLLYALTRGEMRSREMRGTGVRAPLMPASLNMMRSLPWRDTTRSIAAATYASSVTSQRVYIGRRATAVCSAARARPWSSMRTIMEPNLTNTSAVALPMPSRRRLWRRRQGAPAWRTALQDIQLVAHCERVRSWSRHLLTRRRLLGVSKS
jgi:hypothetical protein